MPAHNVRAELAAASGTGSSASGSTYTQTYSTAARTVPNATVVAVAGATPAGGTGATAGAYDTAANRDILIATVAEIKVSVNALVDDVLAIKKVVTALVDDLQTAQIVD